MTSQVYGHDALVEKDIESSSAGSHGRGASDDSPDAKGLPEVRNGGSKPKVLDWDGPHDPGNPQNWSRMKKFYAILVPGLLAFQITLGISTYTSALPEIMEVFHVSDTVALLGLTLYTLGLLLGPVLGAPISETSGRKAVYVFSLPASLLFHMGSGLADSLAALLICRFFAGVFGSPAIAIGAGTIADVFNLQDGAVPATFFIMMPFLGPSLGPVMGGYLATISRRWFAWISVILGGLIMVMLLFSDETYKPIILSRRAKKRGLALPPPPPAKAAAKVLLTVTLFRPFEMLYVEPIVCLLSLYTGFLFGVMCIFFEGFDVSFAEAYGFSVKQTGLTFLGLGLGIVGGGIMYLGLDRVVYQKERRKAVNGIPDPEHRLYAAMAGSVFIPVGIFWFAWTTYPGVHWISAVIAGAFFGWGNFSIFLSTMTYLIDTYQARAGASAAAANGTMRYILGATFPLFAFQMYDNLGRHWAGSVLGFLSLALMPLPWIFFTWGKQIRRKSKYAVGNF